MPTWFVYIIETDKSNLYTGITTDPDRRFVEHANVFWGIPGAKGAKFFRSQKPIKIVYSAPYCGRAEASRAEREIKKLSKIKKLAFIKNAL